MTAEEIRSQLAAKLADTRAGHAQHAANDAIEALYDVLNAVRWTIAPDLFREDVEPIATHALALAQLLAELAPTLPKKPAAENSVQALQEDEPAVVEEHETQGDPCCASSCRECCGGPRWV